MRDEIHKLLEAPEKVIPGVDDADYNKIQLVYFVLQRGFGGTKIQIKPVKTEVVDGVEKVTKGTVSLVTRLTFSFADLQVGRRSHTCWYQTVSGAW